MAVNKVGNSDKAWGIRVWVEARAGKPADRARDAVENVCPTRTISVVREIDPEVEAEEISPVA